MKTVGELRNLADSHLFNGAYEEALKAYLSILEFQSLQLDVRLRVADSLLALGEVQRAAIVYAALARHTSIGGYPLHALVALKILSTLDPQLGSLLHEFAELYASGSPRLGRGSRVALPDPNQALPADFAKSYALSSELLYDRAQRLASNYENIGLRYPEKLAPVPLLSMLPAKDFAQVLAAIKLLRVPPNTAVIREGESGQSFFVLARGSVAVTKKKEDGSQLNLAVLHNRSIFGEMALLSSSPRNATVSSITDCDLLEFDKDALGAASSTVASIGQALNAFTQERLLSNLLNTAALFKPLDKEQRVDLMRRFLAYDAEPGTVLIKEGEHGKGLFVILRGEVEVSRSEGGYKRILACLGAGEVFGEISLLNNEPTTATVETVQPSTVLFLGREYFQRLIQAVPEIHTYVEQLGEERLMDLRLSEILDDEELPIGEDGEEEFEILI